MRLRRTTFAGALLATLALLVSLAGPASAAQTYGLLTAYGAAPHDGRARVADGEVAFPARSTFRVSGRINDECPADGYGAYLYVSGAYANGDSISALPILVAKDTTTCEASGVGYTFNRSFVPDPDRAVAWVKLVLYERVGTAGAYGDVASSRVFDNPRV